MQESSSSDLDRGRNDPSWWLAIADFTRNAPLPSVVPGAAAKESWVTVCVNTTDARLRANDIAATQAVPVKIAKDAGVG